jgi:hypothetical protein
VSLMRRNNQEDDLIWIVAIVVIVVLADALYARSRIRLRTRAEHHARRPSHELSSGASHGGWRSLTDEAGQRAEPEAVNPLIGLDRIIGNNSRHEPPRRAPRR